MQGIKETGKARPRSGRSPWLQVAALIWLAYTAVLIILGLYFFVRNLHLQPTKDGITFWTEGWSPPIGQLFGGGMIAISVLMVGVGVRDRSIIGTLSALPFLVDAAILTFLPGLYLTGGGVFIQPMLAVLAFLGSEPRGREKVREMMTGLRLIRLLSGRS